MRCFDRPASFLQLGLRWGFVALLGATLTGETSSAQPAGGGASGIPHVVFSTQHRKLNKVMVGDQLPDAKLVNAGAPDSEAKELSLGYGRAATVVAVFNGRGRMTRTMLRDLRYDVAEAYAKLDTGPEAKRAVTMTAIATRMPAEDSLAVAKESEYTGPVQLDPEGTYFAQLGAGRLPRVYVLDSAGKIVWMDIEYSPSTRRELRQTLQALTAKLRK